MRFMTNCIFYSLIFALFLSFTSGAIDYSRINRSFMSIYKGIFEASTISVDQSGESITPYFDENILKYYLTNYLKDNIGQYCTDYKIKLYYFNREDHSICIDGICRDVEVTLEAKINFIFDYKKTQSFSVYKKGEL